MAAGTPTERKRHHSVALHGSASSQSATFGFTGTDNRLTAALPPSTRFQQEFMHGCGPVLQAKSPSFFKYTPFFSFCDAKTTINKGTWILLNFWHSCLASCPGFVNGSSRFDAALLNICRLCRGLKGKTKTKHLLGSRRLLDCWRLHEYSRGIGETVIILSGAFCFDMLLLAVGNVDKMNSFKI